jgi:hypothetical protein
MRGRRPDLTSDAARYVISLCIFSLIGSARKANPFILPILSVIQPHTIGQASVASPIICVFPVSRSQYYLFVYLLTRLSINTD